MVNDVEKRWNDPPTFRAAAIYVVVVVVMAGLSFFVFGMTRAPIGALGVPVLLFAGGVGAFLKTYCVWRAEGVWPIWHGAGWFLLTLMLVSLSVPVLALSR
ncbi:hypothetical protein [Mycobacterium angelicum]|uniref:Transmembrane protein n=1 Tax=Mycobacterium angelicum TaxID=470074 RepID=A0A1W9ZK66_MYCAN|nr:hypothetical protein [Mycobacterium angelicum]MCV7196162.1 hypothetical protein [Mycobacterium angelicum]ORA17261.1 hypothetical protein BST12_19935 [Mycobacterium angelicum]